MKKNKFMLIISIFLVIFSVTMGITAYLRLKDNGNKGIYMNQNIYEDIDDGKENIINIEFQPFYGHEPNLEFLTNEADIIVSGTIDTSSLESVVENAFIYTNMDIHVIKVYKNSISHKYNIFENNDFNVLNIKTLGGKLSAKDYIKSLDDSEKTKYSLTEEELEKYSFSLDSSNGKLNYKEENTEYLFFLNYVNGDLVPNSNHYGIRKIKGTKVYDYETDSYIETALLD